MLSPSTCVYVVEPCATFESVWHLTQCRQEASKAAEADAVKARSMVRQERLDWEKADAESRAALHSLREEWRMLQDTNAHLHANVTRLTKSLEVLHSLLLHA